MLSAFRLLTLLALPAAIEAFYSMGKSRLNAMSNLDDMIMQPMNANCHNNKDSSVSYLYGSEDPDPNRRVQKIVVMGAKRKKVRQRSENEKFMEELVIGRWKLEEHSIDRPDPHLARQIGMKKAAMATKERDYEESLLFDEFFNLHTKMDGTKPGFGLTWGLQGVHDNPSYYSPPSVVFRICRKEVGIDFDEYDDINSMPSMFFYRGAFTDGDFRTISGVVMRNRDLLPDPKKKRVVIEVGTFKMMKTD